MPRLTNVLPSYRKHSSGNARVTLNGRDYLLGPYGTKASRQEYDRLIAEYLASGRSTSFGVEPDVLTMAMVMLDYLKFSEGYFGTGTTSELHRIKYALRPLKELYASLPAVEFGPTNFKVVRQKFIDAGQCRNTVNHQMKRIVRMFKWIAAEGRLPASVYETLRLIPGLKRGRTEARETKPILPVSDDAVAATIEHLPPTIADMVRLQRLLACRPGELVNLKPIMVDRSEAVWKITLSEHKTAHHGKSRILFAGPQSQAILMKYLLRASDSPCFSPREVCEAQLREREARRKTPPTYGNRRGTNRVRKPKRQPGEQYTRHSYARAIERACDMAFPAPQEVKDDPIQWKAWKSQHRWTPNQLRHARATEIRKQYGIESASSVLGHSQLSTTEIYAEQDAERAIAVANAIG